MVTILATLHCTVILPGCTTGGKWNQKQVLLSDVNTACTVHNARLAVCFVTLFRKERLRQWMFNQPNITLLTMNTAVTIIWEEKQFTKISSDFPENIKVDQKECKFCLLVFLMSQLIIFEFLCLNPKNLEMTYGGYAHNFKALMLAVELRY